MQGHAPTVIIGKAEAPEVPVAIGYPDPTPEMLAGDPLFDAIWGAIKGWDISRFSNGQYAGASGNDVRRIYDAVKLVLLQQVLK
jgi:hypothetical protein